jgi:uncharacterized membrane protein YfcA
MNIFILSIIFLLISLLFSMLGLGGGILYVPVLIFSKISIHNAAAISLSIILVTSLSALFVFLKNKLVDWKLALLIDPPTDVMAFLGGYYSVYFSEDILKFILVFALILAATFMMRKAGLKTYSSSKKTCWIWNRNFNGRRYDVNLIITLPITAGIGLLAGMIGITGGIIKLPLMVLLCGVPMDIAIATSTVMVAVTALFGLFGHVLVGHFDWNIVIPLGIVAFIGGQIGSRLSVKTDKEKMKKIFGVLLIVIAIKILLEIFNSF